MKVPAPPVVAQPRRWPLTIAALTALVMLTLAVAGLTLLFIWQVTAPTASAVVTKVSPRDTGEAAYYVRFDATSGDVCDESFFVTDTGRFAVGDTLTVHYTGQPALCSNVRQATDTTWWIPYSLILAVIAAMATFIFTAWRRPDILGRLAIRYRR